LRLAPQGIGAALVMPISGRLTDKLGGGIVSVFGVVVMTVATIALTWVTAHTRETTSPRSETTVTRRSPEPLQKYREAGDAGSPR